MIEKRVDKSDKVDCGPSVAFALSKAQAAKAISCSIKKFDAMVKAGTMPKPKLLIDNVSCGKNIKKVWSIKELDKYFHQLPSEGEDQPDDWSSSVANVVKEEIMPRARQSWEQAKPELEKAAAQVKQGWEQAKPKLEQTKEQLKQDWELAKPELQKAKERARELAKRLRN